MINQIIPSKFNQRERDYLNYYYVELYNQIFLAMEMVKNIWNTEFPISEAIATLLFELFGFLVHLVPGVSHEPDEEELDQPVPAEYEHFKATVPALIAQGGGLRTNLLGMSFLNRLESWEVRGDKLLLRGYP